MRRMLAALNITATAKTIADILRSTCWQLEQTAGDGARVSESSIWTAECPSLRQQPRCKPAPPDMPASVVVGIGTVVSFAWTTVLLLIAACHQLAAAGGGADDDAGEPTTCASAVTAGAPVSGGVPASREDVIRDDDGGGGLPSPCRIELVMMVKNEAASIASTLESVCMRASCVITRRPARERPTD